VGPTRVEALTPLTFADPPLGEELYAPPRSNGPEIRSWPQGRYAIGYETTGDPRVWWVGWTSLRRHSARIRAHPSHRGVVDAPRARTRLNPDE
jgi:hypothetical protein